MLNKMGIMTLNIDQSFRLNKKEMEIQIPAFLSLRSVRGSNAT